MSRLVSLFSALALVSTMSGCCLLGHGMYGGGYAPYGGGYYGGGGCSPCQTGACGAMGPGYPTAYNPAVPQTSMIAPTTASNYAPQMVMYDRMPTY